MKLPTREEANAWLEEAYQSNPRFYDWRIHVRNAAKVMEALAIKAELDSNLAYIMAMTHDIGRGEPCTEGDFKPKEQRRGHEIVGYEILCEKGYPELAKSCITHSITPFDMSYSNNRNMFFENKKDIAFIEDFVKTHKLTIYDKMLQLCDLTCGYKGFKTPEHLVVEVINNYYGGVPPSDGSYEARVEYFRPIKAKLDELCKTDVYELEKYLIGATKHLILKSGVKNIYNPYNQTIKFLVEEKALDDKTSI